MKILGVDPGYDRIGVAIIDEDTILFSDCFVTNKNSLFEDRLYEIIKKFNDLLEKYEPELVALEKLFFNTNQKTAMRVAEVRGALISSIKARGLPLEEYTPPQIKIAVTGYGRSTKQQVAHMVERLLKLEDKKRLDDEYDAIAVALTCKASFRSYQQ
jgi:crossover junction endodeoxyribonuclease RuvC